MFPRYEMLDTPNLVVPMGSSADILSLMRKIVIKIITRFSCQYVLTGCIHVYYDYIMEFNQLWIYQHRCDGNDIKGINLLISMGNILFLCF